MITVVLTVNFLFPPFRVAQTELFLNSSVKSQMNFLLYLEHRYFKLSTISNYE